MSPGSLSGRATEIFQEGVRIPPIKVVERGRPNEAALDLIFSNMRGERERRGDYQAMLGTCRKAAERVEELVARYGAPTIREAVAELMDRAEARMRRAIRGLSAGEYVYEAHLEAGTERLDPLTVRARSSSPATRSRSISPAPRRRRSGRPTSVRPWRRPARSRSSSRSRSRLRRELGRLPAADGDHPAGTIVNADPPAPCGGMVEVKYCVESAVMGALAQALDGKIAGDLKGGGNHCYVGGPHPRTGETFIFYEYPAGGTGGFDGGDGSNTVRTWTESDMTTLQPIEAVEQLYPVRIERTALREDSGGPGRWRGGLGLTREVRIQASGTQLSVLAEKAVLPPFGVCGGAAGATNRFWVRRNSRPVQPSPLPGKVSGFPLERDERPLDGVERRRRVRRSTRARPRTRRGRRERGLRDAGRGARDLRRGAARRRAGSSGYRGAPGRAPRRTAARARRVRRRPRRPARAARCG
jgi:N-methylhydantoinase B